MKLLSTFMICAAFMTQTGFAQPQQEVSDQTIKQPQTKQEVLTTIEKVNDYWQSHNSAKCRGFWDNAAYFTGNQAVYDLTGEQRYLDYAIEWAEYNHWEGATQKNKSLWQYKTYGEGMNHVLFADWQICFQVYIDLYKQEHRTERIQRALEVMCYQASTPERDYWWWADALYMGMPIFSKLYTVTHDQKLLDKQFECYQWTDSLLFDTKAQLYYRDGKYIYPKVKTVCNDGKSFWARGAGWVMAGLAKVLQDLPKDSKYRAFYLDRFKKLAAGVAKCQQPEGYWTRSMLCPNDAPGYETSGTAFFTYGILWGVNNGILPAKQYQPTIDKAWKYLTTVALRPDYSIGYVQPIGEKPDPSRTVNAQSQAPFGTGAWLLAACEYYHYMK
ncbi:MAG: glycoside hydrolase family 88 protein [Bacteroidaceae bacterium]|nr:glycoside hydrolase family 88 protein [Bacteroidaceae bacterium]